MKDSGQLFRGSKDARYGNKIGHFRGITYGTIPHRFARPEAVTDWNEQTVDCTRFGPQCPQLPVDVGHLLRVPVEYEFPKLEEDEFKCLNLNVTCPTERADTSRPDPVIIWIHGGSQLVTFASAACRVCDPSHIVAQSVALNKPVVLVTCNYRLNIFAFGDGRGERNLALQDQRLAIDWVARNITAFGGDKCNISLAGESAGAVYTHAHTFMDVPIQRAILMSGSLHLSPPQPSAIGDALIQRVSKSVQEAVQSSLADAPADSLLNALSACGVNSIWIQAEPALEDWRNRKEQVHGLMIGDVEYESVLWRNGIEAMTADAIADCFESQGEFGKKLVTLYHINRSRPTSSKLGALDFINDARFALPVDEITERWRQNHDNVYRYVFDQANPWQASSRAHHAADLLYLFDGFDLSFNSLAARVADEFQKRWIEFACGESPWPSKVNFAFGPHGKCGVIDGEELASRRRANCFAYLKKIGLASYNLVFASLATGRTSLLN